jgi:RNA polymerase sigma-70 factor, ECF subfamily
MRETDEITAMPLEEVHRTAIGCTISFTDQPLMTGEPQESQPVSGHEVTRLLQAWRSGDERAFEQLMPLVYGELHRLARRYMAAEQTGHPLQTTALVHEVYLRLIDANTVNWQDRAHFLAICARLMRRVLIDFARSRNFQKRGPGFAHIQLEEAATVSAAMGSELLAVDEALKRLATIDARKNEVVELKFFGGFTVEEIAAILRVSPETVLRDWKLAKAWLLRELSGEDSHGV